jgi:N-acetylglucosamine-6-phosphate deacetylase
MGTQTDTASRPARLAVTNGRLVLPDRIAEGLALVVEDDRIAGITSTGDVGSDTTMVDAGGRLVIPGLVDIHTHGGRGVTFNEPSADAFGSILEMNAEAGVTSVLGTLGGVTIAETVACLDFGRGWQRSAPPGSARLIGMHLESPYIEPAQAGALDPAGIRRADDGSAEPLFEHTGILRILMLAPELPGALELVERLAGRGVVVAAGHTRAKEEQVVAAIERGLSHVTHIWSAMTMTVREGAWRKPGLVETALVDGRLTVEMIADNRHLPPTLMKLATKCIEPERLCVVSDAATGAGLPEGSRLKLGPVDFEVRDGVGMLLDGSAFAGSTTLLGQMLPVLRDEVGLPVVDAVRMCTLTPARVAGWDDRIGSLAPGKLADIVILDEHLAPARVMIGGQWIK